METNDNAAISGYIVGVFSVRFHLGSGINGNGYIVNLEVGDSICPLSSRKWN